MAAIPSPCTGVCRLDPAERCVGCGRTIDEIARWTAMPDWERALVMRRVLATPRPTEKPE